MNPDHVGGFIENLESHGFVVFDPEADEEEFMDLAVVNQMTGLKRPCKGLSVTPHPEGFSFAWLTGQELGDLATPEGWDLENSLSKKHISDLEREVVDKMYELLHNPKAHDGRGKPMEQNFIRRIFKRALKKAGLREIRLHSLRHTYASLLLSQGASPVYVMEQMGHHSISVTVDTYGHWISSENRDAVNRLSKQVAASHTQVAKTKTAQPLEITPLS